MTTTPNTSPVSTSAEVIARDTHKLTTRMLREARGSVSRLVLLDVLVFGLAACQAHGVKVAESAKVPAMGQTVWLTLHGYNYTDHYIDSYSVNGAGGGNLFVSDAGSGGGGGACCVRWTVGQRLPVKVRVRWESSACVYIKNVDGEDFERAKQFFSEEDAWIKGPIPINPQYFETHLYPDGHVEVAITDNYSPPRLKRLALKNGLRPGVAPWPKCTTEQMGQGEL